METDILITESCEVGHQWIGLVCLLHTDGQFDRDLGNLETSSTSPTIPECFSLCDRVHYCGDRDYSYEEVLF